MLSARSLEIRPQDLGPGEDPHQQDLDDSLGCTSSNHPQFQLSVLVPNHIDGGEPPCNAGLY
jgi:hypothetical protein